MTRCPAADRPDRVCEHGSAAVRQALVMPDLCHREPEYTGPRETLHRLAREPRVTIDHAEFSQETGEVAGKEAAQACDKMTDKLPR